MFFFGFFYFLFYEFVFSSDVPSKNIFLSEKIHDKNDFNNTKIVYQTSYVTVLDNDEFTNTKFVTTTFIETTTLTTFETSFPTKTKKIKTTVFVEKPQIIIETLNVPSSVVRVDETVTGNNQSLLRDVELNVPHKTTEIVWTTSYLQKNITQTFFVTKTRFNNLKTKKTSFDESKTSLVTSTKSFIDENLMSENHQNTTFTSKDFEKSSILEETKSSNNQVLKSPTSFSSETTISFQKIISNPISWQPPNCFGECWTSKGNVTRYKQRGYLLGKNKQPIIVRVPDGSKRRLKCWWSAPGGTWLKLISLKLAAKNLRNAEIESQIPPGQSDDINILTVSGCASSGIYAWQWDSTPRVGDFTEGEYQAWCLPLDKTEMC